MYEHQLKTVKNDVQNRFEFINKYKKAVKHIRKRLKQKVWCYTSIIVCQEGVAKAIHFKSLHLDKTVSKSCKTLKITQNHVSSREMSP